jgi:hypothetical protein
MKRLAELEAQVAALAAENEGLKRQLAERSSGAKQPSADALAAAISQQVGEQLVKIEESLRRDFTDKFAGNFFRATEAMTTRVVSLEGKQTEIEGREAALEGRLGEHLNVVGAALDKTKRAQQATAAEFIETLKAYYAANNKTLAEMQAAAEECREALAGAQEAVSGATEFAESYRQIAATERLSLQQFTATGQHGLQQFAQLTHSNLATKFKEIASDAERAMRPTIRRVEELTEKQFLRRIYFWTFGFMFALAVLFGSSYIVQQRLAGEVLRDAGLWQYYFTELPPEQYDKATRLLAEIKAVKNGEPLPEQQQGAAAQSTPMQSATGQPQSNSNAPPRRTR